MQRRIILLTFLINLGVVYGQSSRQSSKPADKRLISVGLLLSPDICYRTLKNTDGQSSSSDIIKQRNDNEITKVGYSAGVNLNVKAGRSLIIETGVNYSTREYRTKKVDFVFPTPDPLGISKARYVFGNHYIDVPFRLKLHQTRGRCNFIFGGGVVLNFLLKETMVSYLEHFNGETERRKDKIVTDGIKKVNVSAVVNAGIRYTLNRMISLGFEPSFNYQILKQTNTPVTSHLWNIGSGFSIHYNL